MYNVNSQIKFKTSVFRSILCDHSYAYIYMWVKLTVSNTAAGAATKNWTNMKIKNYPQFTNCISEINNTQMDSAKNNDLVMPMYSLMEYSDNYFKTSRYLWH